MLKDPKKLFVLLLLLALLAGIIDLPENWDLRIPWFTKEPFVVRVNPPKIDFSLGSRTFQKEFRTHLGLDLAGGTHIVLDADMTGIAPGERSDALASSTEVIERRVNFFGVSEPLVQSVRSGDSFRINVDIPGLTDTKEAKTLIGQTAKLEFREFAEVENATQSGMLFPTLATTKETGLTGKDLKKASLSFSTQTGEPEVAISFTDQGAAKFGELTKRLVGKPLAIFLDDMALTWPRVNTEITDGNAVITGSFTVEEAKRLSLQLNAGALPIPVRIIEERVIGATLGADSIAKSIKAGLFGLGLVALFMILKYGWLGSYAVMALVVYGLLTLALYRILPVTLTLPGIAGFLLSIGMAVDSNILIFERYKEELRRGKPWRIATELGFGKAWESIRDANFTTILTSIVLYNPGNWSFLPASGLVRGFAATLFLGVLVSLFTGIVVTRTFVRVLYHGPKVTKEHV